MQKDLNIKQEELFDALRNLIYSAVPETYFEHIAFDGSTRIYVDDVTISTKPLKFKNSSAKLEVRIPSRNNLHSLKEVRSMKWHFHSVDDVSNNADFIISEVEKILNK